MPIRHVHLIFGYLLRLPQRGTPGRQDQIVRHACRASEPSEAASSLLHTMAPPWNRSSRRWFCRNSVLNLTLGGKSVSAAMAREAPQGSQARPSSHFSPPLSLPPSLAPFSSEPCFWMAPKTSPPLRRPSRHPWPPHRRGLKQHISHAVKDLGFFTATRLYT